MELKFDAKYSKYLLTKIDIKTSYKWGEGWTSSQQAAFDSEMREVFTNAGYIVEPGKNYGCCATLKKSEFDEQLSLYMHPMEFTGYATQEQIDEIIEILEGCNTVNDVSLFYAKEVYEITTSNYKKILANNSKEIIQWLKEYKRTHKYTYDAGFDFARKYRPLMKCFKNNVGYSSLDADIEFINNLLIILEVNELI